MNTIYKQFYVSPKGLDTNPGSEKAPFKTINAAICEVKKVNKEMTGDIIVNIMSGYYQIDNTIVIDEWVSGKNGFNVIFKGTDKTKKPVLSGGVKITGWKKCKNSSLWCAPLDVDSMRTMYVNGLPCMRASSKYLYAPIDNYKAEGSENVVDGIVMPAENFRCDYAHPEELELVWPIEFTLQRTPVETIIKQDDKVIIILKQPCFDFGFTKEAEFTSPGADKEKGKKRFFIENAKELLDEAGKFYWSKTEKVVYYWPYDEEDMETAEIYTCQTEGIIKLAGANMFSKVKNIVLDNLEICYGGWNEVSNEGLITTQADVTINKKYGLVAREGKYIPAQIDIKNADNVHITNCYIHSLGSTAVCMSEAVINSTVTGNKLTDISGTGIMIDHWDHRQQMPANMERCKNLFIKNNLIHRAACEFKGHTAITLFFPQSAIVSHNDIKNTPYSAISWGWGWGGANVTDAHSSRMEYNRIEDVTDVLHDGGHIYMLDTLNGVIEGNYLIRAGEYRGGVYLDSGTRDLVIRNNVMQDTEQWLFARAFVKLERIVAYDNYFEQGSHSERDYINVTDYNNIEAPSDESGNTIWPLEAQKIIDNAGLEDDYKYMLEGSDIPNWRKDLHDFQPTTMFATEESTWVLCNTFLVDPTQGYYTIDGKMPSVFSTSLSSYINEAKPNEWYRYEINVAEDGEYDCEIRTAQREEKPKTTAKVTVSVDGVDVIKEKELPDNGFYVDTYWRKSKHHPNINLGKVKLTKGSHRIKILFTDNTPSFESFRFYNEEIFKSAVYDEGAPV